MQFSRETFDYPKKLRGFHLPNQRNLRVNHRSLRSINRMEGDVYLLKAQNIQGPAEVPQPDMMDWMNAVVEEYLKKASPRAILHTNIDNRDTEAFVINSLKI